MSNPFVLGVIALLNLPATGVVTAEQSPAPSEASFFSASSRSADWQDSALKTGTGTSGLARVEDMQIPSVDDSQMEQDTPVLLSLSDADPSTEIIWDADAAPSEGFLEAPAIPIATWAETHRPPPPPPHTPQPRSTPRGSNSRGTVDRTPPPRRVVGTSTMLTSHSGSAHSFPWGQCTYYVGTQRRITFRGNAKEWLRNGAAAGYGTGSVPVVGAVVVTTESWYGHVGYVEWVSDDGSRFKFSEMNYVGLGVVSRREMSVNDRRVRGFIY